MHLSFLSPPLPLSLPPILSPCADGSHPPSLPALAPPVPRPATSSPLCSAFALGAAALRLRTRRRAPPPHSPWHPAPILAAAPGLRARRGAPPPSSPRRPATVLAAAPAMVCGARAASAGDKASDSGGGAEAAGERAPSASRASGRGPGAPSRPDPCGAKAVAAGGPRRTGALRGGHRRAPASAHAVAPAELAPPPNPAPRPSLSLELLRRVWRPGCRAPIELRARPSSAVGPWRGSSSRRHSSLRSMAAAAMAYARAGPWHGGGLPAPVLPPDPVLSVRRRASSRTSYQRGRRGAGWRLQRVPRDRGYPGGGGDAEQRCPLAAELVGRAEPRGRPPSLERRCPLAAELACRAGPRSSPDERSRLAPMSGGRRKSGA